jgi:uncharacterized protein DUF2877
MPIARVSSEALRILDGHRELSAHSAFETSVNLRAGRRLVNCSTGLTSSPHGIEVGPEDLGRLRRAMPDDGLEWRPLARAMTTRTGEVVMAASPDTVVFDPSLPAARGGGLAGSARALVADLAMARALTGLGDDWGALTTDPCLIAAADSLARGRVDGTVTRWLGRGPGLTPSGDDILVGMLVALQLSRVIDVAALAALREPLEAAAGRLTTDISAEYLHHACRGMAAAPVCDLLVALDRGEVVAVAGAVERLGSYGHTSGMDCALGVVVGLLQHDAWRVTVTPDAGSRERRKRDSNS